MRPATGIFCIILSIVSVALLFGQPALRLIENVQKGKASFYGKEFHGRKTANGEIFSNYDYTAAHRTLPFNSYVRTTNLKNQLSITVRINDRGPFVKSRIIDLSEAAARRIGSYMHGLASVKVEVLNLIKRTPELDSIFSYEVVDCLGNPDELDKFSLILWQTTDLVHMLYVSNELYLHEDVDNVYIWGTGTGKKRIYRMVISHIPDRKKALAMKDYFERKGFVKIILQENK